MYRFKLKEIKVGDTEINRGKKTTVSAIDDETGAIEWDVADVADFSSTYNALKKAKDFIDVLDKSAERTKTDPRIDKFAIDLARLFNDFRSHVRKVYPEEYKRVLRLKEQSSTSQGGASFTPGEGAQYATPYAFRKNKKSKGAADIYYYKLGYKPVPKIKPKGFEVKQLFEYNDFQQKRINHFDEISQNLNDISKLLSNAKDKTIDFYGGNESEYKILYSTDYIFKLLDEIKNKLQIT